MRRFTPFLLALPLALGLALAKEPSVAPGINAPYAKPDFERWQAVFEAEGREVYAKRQAIVAALKLTPGMTVADIGAGSGLFTRLFAPLVAPAGKVYALDIVPGFVEAIQREAKEQELNNVVGLVNPADSTSLPTRSIDLAFVCDTYHHFEYPQTMLASIRQALRPGGQLVIIDYQKVPGLSSDWVMSHVRAGKQTVIQEIEMAGFRLVEDLPLLTENYFLRFEKLE
ncbi:methyltransferase family protein [Sulfuritortus calidifontis]|uniref:Methyltransferase family protein n=1 Tax=Sulfuritortus calidifontis TaxID=1914471 RepID=A0A4R3JYJ3_9PROT|nr:methyltransferase domain-containing protein [Sulfuritortus calidifontis]TCS73805.1 methyltransferase family protein [Sulfuritortus calidifontis]